MSKLIVRNFSVSIDGFAAGPHQSLENPVGVNGRQLHEWIFNTQGGRAMLGLDGGEQGLDDVYFRRRGENIGATIMGRNMFGPVRDDWPDEEWIGWWGEEPPFQHSVFVLTHFPRKTIEMPNGTKFIFVTEGHEAALQLATEAAGGMDVLISGGAETIRQYLRDGLIDEMHLVMVPVFLGSGEHLFGGLGDALVQYKISRHESSPRVTHVTFVK